VALPRCRTDAVSALTCAIGINREGLNFDSLDGGPAHVVALTLVPLSRPAPYVQFIASLVLAIDKLGTEEVLKLSNEKQLYTALCDSAG